jgi:hypothetical protein
MKTQIERFLFITSQNDFDAKEVLSQFSSSKGKRLSHFERANNPTEGFLSNFEVPTNSSDFYYYFQIKNVRINLENISTYFRNLQFGVVRSLYDFDVKKVLKEKCAILEEKNAILLTKLSAMQTECQKKDDQVRSFQDIIDKFDLLGNEEKGNTFKLRNSFRDHESSHMLPQSKSIKKAITKKDNDKILKLKEVAKSINARSWDSSVKANNHTIIRLMTDALHNKPELQLDLPKLWKDHADQILNYF